MPFPQTEVPGRLQAELTSRGLRMTRQRRTILSVVETAKQHLDASQILRKARKLDPQEFYYASPHYPYPLSLDTAARVIRSGEPVLRHLRSPSRRTRQPRN